MPVKIFFGDYIIEIADSLDELVAIFLSLSDQVVGNRHRNRIQTEQIIRIFIE